MKQTRKHLTGEEKVAVLRRHLIDKQAVSDLCDAVGIRPSQFYRWLQQFFENGAQALERNGGTDAAVRSHDALRVEKLEAKLREKNEVIAELLEEHVALKKNSWGGLTGRWLSREMRDQVVDFVRRWARRSEIPVRRLVSWLAVSRSTFHSWCERYGQENGHNGLQPRDFWLQPWERERIIEYYRAHSRDGYRRLTFMMPDGNIVAVSPSTTWRMLRGAGLLRKWNGKESK